LVCDEVVFGLDIFLNLFETKKVLVSNKNEKQKIARCGIFLDGSSL
jgi:hypothetical protein